ncbi:hypothetical protein E4P40_20510 [Blastococcus sp. CT_GayMR20]|uniref:hypothetical protein n=1 Tax=Blastococcus sp. CT_GayMR20 TaxID=2559609 RepID=UPI001073AFD5|nr:hypothetical protein [Blastococcus sp. CT_GayMR20]TFV72494.1 hypothetical protein E4P40_20510 [Blastococcus sp. CT_GayMR20]
MAAVDATAPRWPDVPAGRGHYESFYLRAVSPSEPRGVWIRYTVSQPPGGRPTGQLWFTWFDRDRPGPRAVRVETGEPASGDGGWIRLGDSTFGAAAIAGSIGSPGLAANWSLHHRSDQAPLRHLPRSWMYTARLPRTKLVSPSPTTVFDGTLTLDGETVDVAGWPGMIGHNWGEQHAQQWIWLSGLAFEGTGADTWLDVAIGRIRIGPVTTPWVANGAISLDGERLALGGLGRRVGVTAADDGCVLRLPGAACTVSASVSAPPDAFVTWDYAGPDGGEHRVRNCSVADLAVRVERPDRSLRELTAPGRATYEWGRP